MSWADKYNSTIITNKAKNFNFCARCGNKLDDKTKILGHIPLCIPCRKIELDEMQRRAFLPLRDHVHKGQVPNCKICKRVRKK